MDVFNKEQARRVMKIAEQKLSENDYDGAKMFANKAHSLYPKLDGLQQVLMMIDVYISASNGREDADWYGVLGVDIRADYETLKKQYKTLALLLHPDKNKFTGAEGAFKLVSEAWCVLSDKVKRDSYDSLREWKERQAEMQRYRAWAKAEMEKRKRTIYRSPNEQKPSPKDKSRIARPRKGDWMRMNSF